MSDVGLRVSLDGVSEAQQDITALTADIDKLKKASAEDISNSVVALLGTLAEETAQHITTLDKVMARAKDTTSMTAKQMGVLQEFLIGIAQGAKEAGASQEQANLILEKAGDFIVQSNEKIGSSSKATAELQQKQAESTERLQAAYEKMVAAQQAAGKTVPFNAEGQSLLGAPSLQGRALAPGGEMFDPDLSPADSLQLWKAQTEEMRRAGLATKDVQSSTEELSKEVKGLLDRYDPLGAKLHKLTEEQEAFRDALSTGMKGVSDETILKTEKGLSEEIEKTKQAMEEGKEETDNYSNSLGTLALRYVAPIALGHQLISVMSATVTAGREAELQNIKLNAVLQSTGMVAGFTKTQLDKMAESMQEATAIDSEKMKQAITVLLTFRNVQGDMFERALKLGADYAKLYGGDVASAARLFGRAFEDPVNGMGMLSRSMGTLTEEQKKMIKELSESGNLLGAQGKLAEILEGKIRGVAEAIGGSAVSNVDRFKNAWSDLLKELAKTPEDPTGAGGQIYGFMSSLIKRFTEASTEMRVARSTLLMEKLKRESETGKDTALGYELSDEQRTERFNQSEQIRKALGIKTEQELADERTKIQKSQADTFDEQQKKFWKDNLERSMKNIDSEIALNRKAVEDKVRLFEFAAQQESYTEDERLAFLAKAQAARKELASMTRSELDAVLQLNAVASKGRMDELTAKLNLGQIDKVQFEEQKTEQELLMNEIQQELTERKQSLIPVWELEYKILGIKREQLDEERKQIVARGETAKKLALQKEAEERAKVSGKIVDMQEEAEQKSAEAVKDFNAAQSDKLNSMKLELSLIGKTAEEKATAQSLNELDIAYNKAIGGLIRENNDAYEEQFRTLQELYKTQKAELPQVAAELAKQKKQETDIEDAVKNIGLTFTSAFEDAVVAGKPLRDVLKGIEQDLIRLGTRLLVTEPLLKWGTGIAKGIIPGSVTTSGGPSMLERLAMQFGGAAFGNMFAGSAAVDVAGTAMSLPLTNIDTGPGFATGTEFMVGGVGGLDSQKVSFRASPGETVSVERPDQRKVKKGGGITIHGPLVQVNAQDANSFNKYSGQIGADIFSTLSRLSSRFG